MPCPNPCMAIVYAAVRRLCLSCRRLELARVPEDVVAHLGLDVGHTRLVLVGEMRAMVRRQVRV